MTTILLTDTNNVSLTNGFQSLISGQDETIQRIRLTLTAFQGEWFLDESSGLPYFQDIVVRGVNEGAVEQIYRAAIQDIPGVAEVNELTIGLGNSDFRIMTISITVRTTTGQTITITTGA